MERENTVDREQCRRINISIVAACLDDLTAPVNMKVHRLVSPFLSLSDRMHHVRSSHDSDSIFIKIMKYWSSTGRHENKSSYDKTYHTDMCQNIVHLNINKKPTTRTHTHTYTKLITDQRFRISDDERCKCCLPMFMFKLLMHKLRARVRMRSFVGSFVAGSILAFDVDRCRSRYSNVSFSNFRCS